MSAATRLNQFHRIPRALERHAPRLRRLLKPWTDAVEAELFRRLPDRVMLERMLLPEIASTRRSVLFVGTRSYTARYTKLFASRGVRYRTMDIDPAMARWGAPDHVVGDATQLDTLYHPAEFDCIILNGLFGWGVDDEASINRTLSAARTLLQPQGVLLIGWNSDRCVDPTRVEACSAFAHPDERPRWTCEGVTHIFDWLEAS